MAEDEGVLRLTEMGDSATIQHVFELVLRLKQICNFDPATGESSKFERLAADLGRSGRQRPQGDRLQPMGLRARNARRATLAATPAVLSRRRCPRKNAKTMIDEFRDDPRRQVMLLSYGAGGVGLNLQFAGYVFLFDRWWNPAVEDQAINRAHRIGAAGPVTVTRFLGARHDRAARSTRYCARNASSSTPSSTTSSRTPLGPDPAGNLRPVQAPLPHRPRSISAA